MEIKRVKLGNEEIDIFVENDPKSYDSEDLYGDLDDTKDLNLEEIKKQYDLENTIIIKKDENDG